MTTIQKRSLSITDSNFDNEVLLSKQVVMVDFGADWCPPCCAISPIIDMLATEYSNKAKIAKLDVDENPKIISRYGIRNLPTLLFFRDGKVVDKIVGAVGKKTITDKLNSLL